LIIELAYGQYSFSGIYAYLLGSVTAGLTAFYSFRLISFVFLTIPNGSKIVYLNSHEVKLAIIIPLFILSLFSIFFGFVFSDLFIGIGSDFFGNSLFIHPKNLALIETEFSLPLKIKLLPLFLSLLGISLAIYFYHFNLNFIIGLTDNILGKKIYTFLNGKYLFDVIYNNYFVIKGLQIGYDISKFLDKGIIELIGPYGLSSTLINTGINIAKLDTGIITTYSMYITLSLLFLLFLIFAPILIDISLFNEMRYFIIYFSSLILVISPSFFNVDEK
jgi:NADH-ubiquinone oxidoreductase chain 5